MTFVSFVPTVRRRIAVFGVLFAVAMAGACGTKKSDRVFDGFRGGQADAVRLIVENQNFADMRVFSVTTTRGRQSIGLVAGNSRRTFSFRWRQSGDVRFRLEASGGGEYLTNQISVAPGERIELTIPDNPENAFIRRR